MKKLLVLIITIVVLSISSSAMAGKDSGFYIGGSIGQSSLDIDEFNFDDDDNGYKVFAGYNFGLVPMFDIAIEASYVDFGEVSETAVPIAGDVNVGLTAYDLFGVAAYNIGPVGIFGKVGHVWYDGEISTENLGNLDDSSNDMAYGIGLRFQISSFAIRAEYEMFDIEGADVDLISVGFSYTF